MKLFLFRAQGPRLSESDYAKLCAELRGDIRFSKVRDASISGYAEDSVGKKGFVQVAGLLAGGEPDVCKALMSDTALDFGWRRTK